MFVINQPQLIESPTYILVKDFIPAETCKNIIALSEQIAPVDGATAVSGKRNSDIRWIPLEQATYPLYEKVGDAIAEANAKTWNFHLAGFLEPFQLTHYTAEKAGKYDWHADRGDKGIMMNRKVSASLLLNDGGAFELFDTPPFKLGAGDLLIFPSFHVHRVKPITRGERWSLVIWTTGPSWV
jgi:PKHD-type hydroxylase